MSEHGLSRRTLLRTAGAMAGLGALQRIAPAYAWTNGLLFGGADQGTSAVDLTVAAREFNVNGKMGRAVMLNGSIPGPLLRFREGTEAVIRVRNDLREDTSIHWHGLILPNEMDGVPGVTFAGIKPGETFEYRIPIRQYGTYWYHSHSAGQEQLGVYGPMILDPAGPDPIQADREYVVMLSDWSFMRPMEIVRKLKQSSNYFNYQRLTGAQALSRENLQMFAKMRMDRSDILDVTGALYTYLMNGLPSSENWTGLFKPGERVRLRFINGSAMTIFDVRIPGLKMTVVQAYGQNVHPVEVDEFRFAAGETYDVIVEPTEDMAYTVFAESMDRSDFVRGTLAPRLGMSAAVPERRKRPLRTMTDMGMDMEGMGGMEGMPGMDKGSMPGMDMGGAKKPAAPSGGNMPGMKMHPTKSGGDMGGMKMPPSKSGGDMAGMKMPPAKPSGGGMQGHDMAGMKMPPAQTTTPAGGANHAAPQGGHEGMVMGSRNLGPAGIPAIAAGMVTHGPDRHGPANSMVPMMTKSRLSEPGTGLEDAGHRVLVYTDLMNVEPFYDQRPPTREIELHLTGSMERYIWSINGKKYSEDPTPIRLRYGERVRLTMVNDTMMEHPMHLHGMWMILENGHGANQPRVHTIIVKPAERLSVLVTADAVGPWAYHCHQLYHMELGMFRVFEVTAEGAR